VQSLGAGKIESLSVKSGDSVKAGDVVAKLDQFDLRRRVSEDQTLLAELQRQDKAKTTVQAERTRLQFECRHLLDQVHHPRVVGGRVRVAGEFQQHILLHHLLGATQRRIMQLGLRDSKRTSRARRHHQVDYEAGRCAGIQVAQPNRHVILAGRLVAQVRDYWCGPVDRARHDIAR